MPFHGHQHQQQIHYQRKQTQQPLQRCTSKKRSSRTSCCKFRTTACRGKTRRRGRRAGYIPGTCAQGSRPHECCCGLSSPREALCVWCARVSAAMRSFGFYLSSALPRPPSPRPPQAKLLRLRGTSRSTHARLPFMTTPLALGPSVRPAMPRSAAAQPPMSQQRQRTVDMRCRCSAAFLAAASSAAASCAAASCEDAATCGRQAASMCTSTHARSGEQRAIHSGGKQTESNDGKQHEYKNKNNKKKQPLHT